MGKGRVGEGRIIMFELLTISAIVIATLGAKVTLFYYEQKHKPKPKEEKNLSQ